VINCFPTSALNFNLRRYMKGKFLVLGASSGVDAAILGMALLRNPAGNGDQQTPLAGPHILVFMSRGTSQVASRGNRLKVPAGVLFSTFIEPQGASHGELNPPSRKLTSRPRAATSRAAAAAVVQWCSRGEQ